MPEDRRLTINTSPHLAPDDVARHTFASVRRGFDPGEVRDYLESLAAGLRAQAEHERDLHQQIADAEDRAANPVLDEMTLTAAVGKETARVLQSAHEAAAEVTANARAEADRLLAEATETAEQVRTRADAHLAERTAEAETTTAQLKERTEAQVAKALDKARADAEALTERTREECRAMVEEAQQLRARVLADLSRRRRVLHAQIDQLRAGRERLAETIHDVRRSIDDIADDLFNAEDDARVAAEAAARAVSGRPEEGTPEELAAALLAEEAAVETTTEKPVGASAARRRLRWSPPERAHRRKRARQPESRPSCGRERSCRRVPRRSSRWTPCSPRSGPTPSRRPVLEAGRSRWVPRPASPPTVGRSTTPGRPTPAIRSPSGATS